MHAAEDVFYQDSTCFFLEEVLPCFHLPPKLLLRRYKCWQQIEPEKSMRTFLTVLPFFCRASESSVGECLPPFFLPPKISSSFSVLLKQMSL